MFVPYPRSPSTEQDYSPNLNGGAGTHCRKYSPYSTDYSEDFEKDSSSRSATPSSLEKLHKEGVRSWSGHHKDVATSAKSRQDLIGSLWETPHEQFHARKWPDAKKSGDNQRSFTIVKKPPELNVKSAPNEANRRSLVAQMLHIKQRKIDKIQNDLFDTELKLEALQKENRILRTVQQKQDKAIKKFDDAESNLPRLLSQHCEEQKVLKFRLRKAQLAERSLEVKLRENNKSLYKMENTMRRLKSIVKEKDLGERSRLNKELAKTENNLRCAEQKLEKMNKQIELASGCFLRQIDREKRKHKETKNKLQELQKDCDLTKSKLKKKERALSDAQIYSLRKKPQHQKSKPSMSKTSSTLQILTTSAVQTAESSLSFHIEDRSKSNSTENDNKETEDVDVRSAELEYRYRPKNNTKSEDEALTLKKIESPIIATNSDPDEAENSVSSGISYTSDDVVKPVSQTIHKPLGTPALEPIKIYKTLDEIESKRISCQPVFVTSKFDPTTGISELNRNLIAGEISKTTDKTTKILDSGVLVENGDSSSNAHESNNIESIATKKSVESAKISFESEREFNRHSPVSAVLRSDWKEPERYTIDKRPKKSYQFSKEVENLHLGIPSSIEGCKKKLEKLENEVIYFGSYSPTVGGAPTRRKYLPVKEYKPATRKSSNLASDVSKSDLKRTKESEFLMRLFDKLEIDKEKSLPVCDQSINVSSPAAKTSGTANKYQWESSISRSDLQCNGDSLDVQTKPLFDIKDFTFLGEDDTPDFSFDHT